MTDFTKDIADQVLAACEAGAEKTSAALSQCFDLEIQSTPSRPATLSLTEMPDGFDSAGLVILLKLGETGALLLLPESGDLLPSWYAEPDSTGESKLAALAQELSKLLLPAEFTCDDFRFSKFDKIADALTQGEVVEGAGLLPLALSSEDKDSTLFMIWPVPHPDAVITGVKSTTEDIGAEAAEPMVETAPENENYPAADQSLYQDSQFERLHPYTRSMLKISVPVIVNLASKKKAVEEILELGTGSILKFNKSCEELLDLEVNGRTIAKGEAVKIGDKFGLRISSIVLPEERFHKVEHARKS